jgi:succinate dehydrogenase/fumarate reductase flavoprotein subunit
VTRYDIAIAGAGSAGMVCAIRAAQRGLRVVVVEKDTVPGGTLHVTAGHLSAAGTRRQQEKGINDTAEQHYADVRRICRDTMDAIVARKAIELAPQTLDWLQEMGYPFHEKTPLLIYGHEPYGVPRTYFGTNDVSAKINRPGQTVFHVLKPLWDEQVAKGNIHFLPEHSLDSIRCDGSRVTSLMVQSPAGVHELYADQYVLTTGGYAANPGFFENGPRLISTARHTSMGDGIVAAQNIGAVFQGHEKHSSTLGGMELDPASGRADFWTAWARVSNGVDRKQREIYVNEKGLRFMNEYDLDADERERIVLQQPGRRFWLIFDETALYDGDCVVPQWTADELKQHSLDGKAVWQADSIAALAEKTGLPPDNLQQTIDRFNQYVKNNRDDDFQRTYLQHAIAQPPYYALLVYAYSLISFGGLKVNEQLQIVRQDSSVIENLYAAGEILGAAATSGHAFCGGMLLTPALSFGKWLGEVL